MKKESVNKFDLEAAFKALNEIETPVVKGIRPNRENLQERFTKKLASDVLVEDYYDVNDSAELEAAQEEREAEIAKAKLARIEKIVDLNAESEEDLLPSYVGKYIIQCPQCMTLFYKNQEDIETSEENPEVVNINEVCQHCGNASGYTLVGKVDTVGEEEASEYDIEDFDENELNLDFDPEEETTEEEVAVEEEEELDLAPVEETEEEEEVKESLTEDFEDEIEDVIEEEPLNDEESIETEVEEPAEEVEEILTTVEEVKEVAEEAAEAVIEASEEEPVEDIKEITDEVVETHFEISEEEAGTGEEAEEVIEEEGVHDNENEEDDLEESLTEAVDKELDAKLKAHNEYIEYLKEMIEKEENSLANAKNDFVKKSIQARIDALKADLEAALPEALKDEVEPADLPTPEEAEMEAATENKEEANESLTEDFELKESATEVKNILKQYYVAKNDPENKLGKEHIRALKDNEKLPKKFKFLAGTDKSGLVKYNGRKYYWELDNGEIKISDCSVKEQVEIMNEDTPVTTLTPKRKLASTEILAQQLSKHELFNSLSARTIQRELIPYYIEDMGKENLTAEAIAAYYKELGLGTFILDRFNNLSTNQIVSLANQDPTFVKALRDTLGGHETLSQYGVPFDNLLDMLDLMFGGRISEQEVQERLKVLGEVYTKLLQKEALGDEELTENLPENAEDDLDTLLDSDEFKKPISDKEVENIISQYKDVKEAVEPGIESELAVQDIVDTWESIDDLHEESLNRLTTNYLKEVYSNVNSFKADSCSLDNNKLVIEGTIAFNSGKTKTTTFVFEAKESSANKIILEGLNADFATEKAFVLDCKIDTANCLVVESLNYKYTINNTLVEGLLK